MAAVERGPPIFPPSPWRVGLHPDLLHAPCSLLTGRGGTRPSKVSTPTMKGRVTPQPPFNHAMAKYSTHLDRANPRKHHKVQPEQDYAEYIPTFHDNSHLFATGYPNNPFAIANDYYLAAVERGPPGFSYLPWRVRLHPDPEQVAHIPDKRETLFPSNKLSSA